MFAAWTVVAPPPPPPARPPWPMPPRPATTAAPHPEGMSFWPAAAAQGKAAAKVLGLYTYR